MHRRKIMLIGIAVFALGVAFAAQPTLPRASGHQNAPGPESLWVPGSRTLMSAYEPHERMPPPQ
jgi:hypothetical protein